MLKGIPNKKYTGKFKQMVVETMPKEGMSYSEAALEFDVCDHHRIMSWERIHLEEGPEGLYCKSTGRLPKQFKPKVEEDLIAELQRLRAENAYLKNWRPWLSKRNAKAKGASDLGTETWTQDHAVVGYSEAVSLYVLLLHQAYEGWGQVERNKETDRRHIQGEQGTVWLSKGNHGAAQQRLCYQS